MSGVSEDVTGGDSVLVMCIRSAVRMALTVSDCGALRTISCTLRPLEQVALVVFGWQLRMCASMETMTKPQESFRKD